MKDLLKWQLISFGSRGVAMALGIIQSVVIARILTVSEYGLVGIVTAIGGVFGIYQHLGLASGSTREISAAKEDSEIFKIFVTSVVIRYFITFPLAIGLFFAANYLAIDRYGHPELVLPIQIYAVVLFVQGVQSMFNSVVSGMQRFKTLFVYQALISFVSVLIYIPFIYFFKVTGYFYALLAFNIIGSLALGTIALWPIRKSLVFPSVDDFKRLIREILSISLAIYFVKIFYTMWQKSGPLLLGIDVSPELVGIFSFAMLFSSKIMAVSDAVTDVNLPMLSKKFVSDFEEFRKVFSENFDKIFSFIVFSAVSAVYWAPELFFIAIGDGRYDRSLEILPPLIFAFILYSLINIIKSSILVPAKLVWQMIISYGILLVLTAGFYYFFRESIGHLDAMAYGMAIGAFVSFLFMNIVAQFEIKFNYFGWDHFLILLQGIIISISGNIDNLFIKIPLYLLFSILFAIALFAVKFVTKEQLIEIYSKVSTKFLKAK